MPITLKERNVEDGYHRLHADVYVIEADKVPFFLDGIHKRIGRWISFIMMF